MPGIEEILTNKDFLGMPIGEQFKVLRDFPDFSSLPEKDQGTILAGAKQKALGTDKIGQKPKDAGFGRTLINDAASIPGSLIATGTGKPGDTRPPGIFPRIGAAQHEQFEKGREDLKSGQYVSGAAHMAAGAIPVLGPLAVTTGEEIGSGQYGQAAAHGAELLMPYLKDVPGGKIVKAGAKAVSENVPDIHPLAKTAIRRIPGGGAAIDFTEWMKKLAKELPGRGKPPDISKGSAYKARGESAERESAIQHSPKAQASLPQPKTAAPGAEARDVQARPVTQRPTPGSGSYPLPKSSATVPWLDEPAAQSTATVPRPQDYTAIPKTGKYVEPWKSPKQPSIIKTGEEGYKPRGESPEREAAVSEASPRAKASLPEPKTAKPTSSTPAAADSKSPVDAPRKPMPGKPPAETLNASDEGFAKDVGKLLRGKNKPVQFRPDDVEKLTGPEWEMLFRQTGFKGKLTSKMIEAAAEHNRKLWAESQADLQARRKAHFEGVP